MTRRDAVRILLFERARLVGLGGAVRCAIVDLSAIGALVTVTGSVPRAPLRLEFELGGEPMSVAVDVQRAAPGEHVAVTFIDPPVDQLHRLIADEQRLALAAGRPNVRERRARRRARMPGGDSPR
jgi:hypothetical protein